MLKEIKLTSDTLFITEDIYQKLVDHLEIMNLWKYDPRIISEHPILSEAEFTLFDSFQDLLIKGLL